MPHRPSHQAEGETVEDFVAHATMTMLLRQENK